MIDIDNKRMESEIKEKDKECRELETRFEGLKLRFRKERKRSEVTNSQFYKLKFEEKCSEVFNLHRDLTDAEIKNRQDKSRSQSPIEFLRTEPAERPRQSKSPLLRNNSNGNITKKLVRVRSARRSASSMYKPINT